MGIWQTGDLYVGTIGEFSSGTDRVRPVSHTLGGTVAGKRNIDQTPESRPHN